MSAKAKKIPTTEEVTGITELAKYLKLGLPIVSSIRLNDDGTFNVTVKHATSTETFNASKFEYLSPCRLFFARQHEHKDKLLRNQYLDCRSKQQTQALEEAVERQHAEKAVSLMPRWKGHRIDDLVRWMGSDAWLVTESQEVMQSLGFSFDDEILKRWLKDGRQGKGNLADVTEKQSDYLYFVAK